MKMSNSVFQPKRLNKSISNHNPKQIQNLCKIDSQLGIKAPILGYYYYPSKNNINPKPRHTNFQKKKNKNEIYNKAKKTLLTDHNELTQVYHLTKENKTNDQKKNLNVSKEDSVPMVSTKRKETDQFSTNIRDNIDVRLEYTLNALNIEGYLNAFQDNKIMFDDLILLTKEDLKEMNIPIGPRNRLLSFKDDYKLYAEKYTLKEIQSFFHKNKFLEHFSSTNIWQTDACLPKHQKSNFSSLDFKESRYPDPTYSQNEAIKTEKNSGYENWKSKYQLPKQREELTMMLNRKTSPVGLKKEELMRSYNSNDNNQNNFIKISSTIPRNKSSNFGHSEIPLNTQNNHNPSNRIDQLLYDSNYQIQPYSEQNRFHLKNNRSNLTLPKGKNEINRLFQIEANLKQQLSQCNKSINEKQLVRII